MPLRGLAGAIPPCSLLTQPQVEAFLGQVAGAGQEQTQPNGPLTVHSCTWKPVERPKPSALALFVTVAIIQPLDATGPVTTKQYFDETRASLKIAVTVPGLRD